MDYVFRLILIQYTLSLTFLAVAFGNKIHAYLK